MATRRRNKKSSIGKRKPRPKKIGQTVRLGTLKGAVTLKKAARVDPIKSSRKTPRRPGRHLTDLSEEFIESAEAIFETYKVLKAKRDNGGKSSRSEEGSPYSRPMGVFRREMYKFLRSYIHRTGGNRIIESIARGSKIGYAKGPSYRKNPYYVGLVAMVQELQGGNALSLANLGLYARQMLYADRHDVPPCLFVGFLHQAGITSSISVEKAAEGEEPWDMEDRVRKLSDTD